MIYRRQDQFIHSNTYLLRAPSIPSTTLKCWEYFGEQAQSPYPHGAYILVDTLTVAQYNFSKIYQYRNISLTIEEFGKK